MAKPKNIDFIRETLRDLGEATAKQVQTTTGLSSSTVSDNLRKLVDQGLVERREDHDEMAAGSGTVVLWRVLEQHEIPAGADEPPVDRAAVADALDEIAKPTVVPAAYKGDHQGATVVELPDEPVLDPAAPIEVDDQRPQSVADVLDDAQADDRVVGAEMSYTNHGFADANVMEPHDETPADGHWPTADEVDEGVAEWERQREAVDRSNYEREVQQGGGDVDQAHAEALAIVADDVAARTSAEPASSDPSDVLAYMQSVRPVSPAPVGEPAPAPRQRRSSSTSGEQRDTSAFFKRGALSDRIAQWMREHADQSYGPTDVAKALGAQTGSVGYAMDKLHQQGSLQLTQAKPKRYQANAAE